jgi:GH15 family glucan-1,4-alpha-glucosidase
VETTVPADGQTIDNGVWDVSNTSRIEDYAMIGDCKTAALVSRRGSIDWMCLPRFDSGACFAALLGTSDHGRWCIAPIGKVVKTTRSYVDGSLILQTIFETDMGKVELTDFMPIDQERSRLVRILRGLEGKVAMHFELVVRFDYGVTEPWVFKVDEATTSIVAGPDRLVLHAPIDPHGVNMRSLADFTVRKGEAVSFVLSHGSSHLASPSAIDAEQSLEQTKVFWTDWSARCPDVGRWTSTVRRSLITLKGLSYLPTGGIVAAVTTSLPELIGGARNWDYRYCWLRDATFTLLAFLNAGYDKEAHLFRDWVLRAVAGSPAQIQIMYGLAGERRLDEWELPWLPGFEGSAPVRVGNAAWTQQQLDIYGELFDAMTAAANGGLESAPRSSEFRDIVLDHLEQTWAQPDQGIWEIRGPAQHFTHSKVMAWVAFDRAASNEHLIADRTKRDHYREVADEIHDSVCLNAVDPELNCFTQVYGGRHIDAGLLLLAIVGFLPPEDERIRNTIVEIEKRLLVGDFILRYEMESAIDGLPPGEGAFLACSFWLIDNYVLQGRMADADSLFERLVEICNDVGLLSEEYDPAAKRQLGNFPQAFSHVALVNSAFAIARAQKPGNSHPADDLAVPVKHVARHRSNSRPPRTANLLRTGDEIDIPGDRMKRRTLPGRGVGEQ